MDDKNRFRDYQSPNDEVAKEVLNLVANDGDSSMLEDDFDHDDDTLNSMKKRYGDSHHRQGNMQRMNRTTEGGHAHLQAGLNRDVSTARTAAGRTFTTPTHYDSSTIEYMPTVVATIVVDPEPAVTTHPQGGVLLASTNTSRPGHLTNDLSTLAEMQNQLIGLQQQLRMTQHQRNDHFPGPFLPPTHEANQEEDPGQLKVGKHSTCCGTSRSRYRRSVIAVVIVAVAVAGAIAVAMIMSGPSPEPPIQPIAPGPATAPIPAPSISPRPTTIQIKSFESNDELREAVKRWLEGENTTDTELATTYGYPIGAWDVSRITDFSALFSACTIRCGVQRLSPFASTFNANISKWNVSAALSMREMFYEAKAFDGDLSAWDVSHVTNTSSMFQNADAFNGDLSSWDVSNVEDMSAMFAYTDSFDGDISAWNVSKVLTMSRMFLSAKSFNGDIANWDVSSVIDMNHMFHFSPSFNGDISSWNVVNLKDMSYMFYSADSFNQDLCGWGSYLKNNNANVNNAFGGSGCVENVTDPDLSASVPGPLCHACS